jgi:hypothetical protein
MPAGQPYVGQPLGYQQITNLAAAVGLVVPAGARFAIIQAEAANIRWRDDGTNPTATVGIRLLQDDTYGREEDLKAVKFIQETLGGILNVAYYE